LFHGLDKALRPHVGPVLLDKIETFLTPVLPEDNPPAIRHIGENRPQRMLSFFVNQDEVLRIFILERVRRHRLILPYRYNYFHAPGKICQDQPGSGSHPRAGSDQLRPSGDAISPFSKRGTSGPRSWPSSARACSLAPSCIALLTTEDLIIGTMLCSLFATSWSTAVANSLD